MKHLFALFFLLTFAVTASAQIPKAMPLSGVAVKIVSARSGEPFFWGRTDAEGKLRIEVKVDSSIYVISVKMPDTTNALPRQGTDAKSGNIPTPTITMDFTLADMDGATSHKIVIVNDVRTMEMLDLSGGKPEAGHFGKIVDVTVTAPAP